MFGLPSFPSGTECFQPDSFDSPFAKNGFHCFDIIGGNAKVVRYLFDALAAILDACAHATSPPSLRQLLSHPYFAPVEGFDREDVRAAYRRWRGGGAGRAL